MSLAQDSQYPGHLFLAIIGVEPEGEPLLFLTGESGEVEAGLWRARTFADGYALGQITADILWAASGLFIKVVCTVGAVSSLLHVM